VGGESSDAASVSGLSVTGRSSGSEVPAIHETIPGNGANESWLDDDAPPRSTRRQAVQPRHPGRVVRTDMGGRTPRSRLRTRPRRAAPGDAGRGRADGAAVAGAPPDRLVAPQPADTTPDPRRAPPLPGAAPSSSPNSPPGGAVGTTRSPRSASSGGRGCVGRTRRRAGSRSRVAVTAGELTAHQSPTGHRGPNGGRLLVFRPLPLRLGG
jgi:hypothetical protein